MIYQCTVRPVLVKWRSFVTRHTYHERQESISQVFCPDAIEPAAQYCSAARCSLKPTTNMCDGTNGATEVSANYETIMNFS